MHTPTIHQAFEKMIAQRAVHFTLQTSSGNVRYMRWRLKNNLAIPLDTKIKYLQLAGYRLDQFQYTEADLVNVIKFTIRTSEQARAFGAGFVLEKWKALNPIRTLSPGPAQPDIFADL